MHRFILTFKEAFQKVKDELLGHYDTEELTAIAELLLEDKYGLNRQKLAFDGEQPFQEIKQLMDDIGRLKKMEPVQHIVGFQYFNGMKVKVSRDVLIPRPETEELTQLIRSREKDHKGSFIDLCTGSGCIALSLRKFFPGIRISASDLSEAALELASESELSIFGDHRIEFIRHDLLTDEPFDTTDAIVVSNPPYIMRSESEDMNKNVLEHEPHLALFADGEDPLIFYKTILRRFSAKKIYFELNPLTAIELRVFASENGWETEIISDMFGKSRFGVFKK